MKYNFSILKHFKSKNLIVFVLHFILLNQVFSQSKLYKTKGSDIGEPNWIYNTKDSGFIMSGSNDTCFEIIKLDGNANLLWQRNFNSKIIHEFTRVKPSNDNGYWIMGSTTQYDTLGDAFICKLNACLEIEWGQLFRIPELNYIHELIELNENQIILTMCGNSFRITNVELYSHIGIFDIHLKKYTKQFLIPLDPLSKKITTINQKYYLNFLWTFKDKSIPNLYHTGSTFLDFDDQLNFNIKYFQPFEIPETHPYFYTTPIELQSGNIISGGFLIGIRSDNYSPLSFVKLDKNLNRIKHQDMGHVINKYHLEQVESILSLSSDKFIALQNYSTSQINFTLNCIPEFFIIDTNFNELKKVRYGNYNQYKYFIKDAIITEDNYVLVLLRKFESFGNISYELVKINENLDEVNFQMPLKTYDYHCFQKIDTFGTIDISSIQTTFMSDWSNIVKVNDLTNENNSIDFTIYPNPTNKLITVLFRDNESGAMSIYNALGEIVYNQSFQGIHAITYDFSEQNDGLYFIKLKTLKGEFTKLISLTK